MRWYGIDLDGTLADSKESDIDNIGKVIEPMRIKVLNLISKGEMENFEVRIFTARASIGDKAIETVKKWLGDNDFPDMKVTAVKNLECIEIWDDRCRQVLENKGEFK